MVISDYLTLAEPRSWYSEVESKRFGRRVIRLVIPLACPWSDTQITKSVNCEEFDLLILRAPASRLRLAGSLSEHHKCSVLQADTLLYFSGSTTQAQKPDGGEVAVTLIRPDPEELEELIRISFDGYSNHYAANLSLPSHAVMEGYAEWARNLLERQENVAASARQGNDTVSFIVGHPVGEVRNQKSFEVALNGTHPSFRNRGIYQILLRHLMSELRLQGIETVWISTQASNRAMIRTWEKLGLRFEFAVNTLHCSPQR